MLSLALILFQVSSAAPAQPLDESLSAAEIRIGDTITGELSVQSRGDHNGAVKVYRVSLREPGAFTARLDSFDFNPCLSIEDAEGKQLRRDGNSGAYWNAWLVHDVESPATLFLRIASEDSMGGEFVLSIVRGRLEPPKGAKKRLAGAEFLIQASERAQQRGQIQAALDSLGKASLSASLANDLALTRNIADRQVRMAMENDLPVEAIKARAQLGRAEMQLSDDGSAEATLESALADAERALATADDSNAAQGLAFLVCFICDTLASLEQRYGNREKALHLGRRWVEVSPRAGRPKDEPLAHQRLGEIYDWVGDVEHARQSLEKSLELAERSQDPELIAAALLACANHFKAGGDTVECRRRCERALALSKDAALQAPLLGTLGSALVDLGHYEQAIATMDELERLCERSKITKYKVPTRINRAFIAFLLGDSAKARMQLEPLLDLDEAGCPARERIDILIDLGMFLSATGEDEEARIRYEQALAECVKIKDRDREAKVLSEWARLDAGRIKAYSTALSTYDRVEGIAKQLHDQATANTALGGRAYILFLMGELACARELAREAVHGFQAIEMGEQQLDAQDTLARIGLRGGDLDAVEDALCTAKALLADQAEQRLDSFDSAGLRSRFADWGGIEQDLIAARLRLEEKASRERSRQITYGWQQAGQWKGRVLLERLHSPTNDAGLMGNAARPESSERMNSGDIHRLGPSDGGRTISRAAPQDALRGMQMPQIGPSTAIIEYVAGLEKLYAYVDVRESLQFVELSSREPLEARARRFVDALAAMKATPREVLEDGSWLYEHLVAPLSQWLPPEIETLIIVPTPELADVPFDALVRSAPMPSHRDLGFDELHYLIDDYCVLYSPSCPVLADLQRSGTSHRPLRFLIFADPVYPSESQAKGAEDSLASAGLPRSLLGYRRLERTRDEAFEVARLLLVSSTSTTNEQHRRLNEIASERSPSMTTSSFDLFMGSQARPAVLGGDLSGYTNLHFATHGKVDRSDPRRSGLLLSCSAVSDGFVTLEDVLKLKLDADLVVLSACDTARGSVVRGEGIESVAYGFLQAGARSVIATQWPVRDDQASLLARKVYSLHFVDHLPYDQALRKAKTELRHSREPRGGSLWERGGPPVSIAANPHFWSPFVIIGAPPE